MIGLQNNVKYDDKIAHNSYLCGVDYGNGKSKAVFTIFKGGNLVWHTRKMWKAKLYLWWKRIWNNATVWQKQK